MKNNALSGKQEEILNFVKQYKAKNGQWPTLEQIASRYGRSIPTIHEHIKALRLKGYLKSPTVGARNIGVSDPNEEMSEIALLGMVSAGGGIENLENPELIKVQKSLMSTTGKHYALLVRGTSMIDDGIFPDDIIIVKYQHYADNGDVVVALFEKNGNQLATVKRFYHHGNRIELRPKNPELVSQWYTPGDIEIRGKFISLLRKG